MKSYIELDAANLVHNLQLFKEHTGKKIMFVVKANAYGHGLKQVIEITKDLPIIDYYAVDSLEEALTVRKIDTKKNILVIGWADQQELTEMIQQNFEIIAPSCEHLELVNQVAQKLEKKARVHVKVETGTSRLGMEPADVLALFHSPRHNFIEITGLYSHFANIEDTTDHSFALKQLNIFKNLVETLQKEKNDSQLLKHFSCSAASLLFPETYFDIVRVGISAYGFWPSKETYISYIEQNGERINLKPVLRWCTQVAQVKQRRKGETIGYGLTYRTFSDARIAVIPVGYYDGYDRRFSNVANILVNGVKAPVRGRVCMNMFMAEVTHIPGVKEGDRAILIGREGEEGIDADYLAGLAGTINYEIISRINPLIPRIIV